jgi:hypothetical protein
MKPLRIVPLLFLTVFVFLPWVIVIHANGQETDPAAKATELHGQWKKEKDLVHRNELADQVIRASYYGDKPEYVEDIARDGEPQRLLTAFPKPGEVRLQAITRLAGVNYQAGNYPASPVIRRITEDRIEVWTTKEGWLLDAEGRIKNHVVVPRRDGTGREWFGAFLPDGRWITTDIWEMDKTVTGYSADGKWLWEIKGAQIFPPGKDDETQSLIGWARSDRDGEGWIVSVGSEGGRGYAWIDGSNPAHIKRDVNPWKLAYPRALGSRGYYCFLSVPNDEFDFELHRAATFHGVDSSFPSYGLPNRSVQLPSDGTFGFWPDSMQTYIESDGWTTSTEGAQHRTWFFDKKGRYQGEIVAAYLADADNNRDLLFLTPDQMVLQLTPNLKVKKTRRFVWKEGDKSAQPIFLQEDLRIGIFTQPKGLKNEVVLARW